MVAAALPTRKPALQMMFVHERKLPPLGGLHVPIRCQRSSQQAPRRSPLLQVVMGALLQRARHLARCCRPHPRRRSPPLLPRRRVCAACLHRHALHPARPCNQAQALVHPFGSRRCWMMHSALGRPSQMPCSFRLRLERRPRSLSLRFSVQPRTCKLFWLPLRSFSDRQ